MNTACIILDVDVQTSQISETAWIGYLESFNTTLHTPESEASSTTLHHHNEQLNHEEG